MNKKKEQIFADFFNTADYVKSLNVLDSRIDNYKHVKRLYLSADSQSKDKIALLSFAIYQLQ
jgi:hypothetical protein